MSATTPRIPNLPRAKWTDAAREVFSYWGEPNSWENGSRTNTVMVMANHPKLGMAYNAFGRQVLLDSTLPMRPRELVVLRMSWLLKAEYEWHYHVGYAISAGITLEEIAAVKDGADAPAWSAKAEDRAVLKAVDELLADATIEDETWAALRPFFDDQQLMDLVFTAANYVMMTWAINAFRIPLEAGVDKIGFDLNTASGKRPDGSFRPGETENWADSSGL
jgi:4-carboxymuconolactone decarboxylase